MTDYEKAVEGMLKLARERRPMYATESWPWPQKEPKSTKVWVVIDTYDTSIDGVFTSLESATKCKGGRPLIEIHEQEVQG